MHFAALAIGVLLSGSQAVLATTFKFKFSKVEQCEPVSITLFGDTPTNDVPTTLTVLPFNSQPISIPIPNAMANTSSISVSFLPLPVNTTFVATLDNSGGFSATWVSDIIRVQPSQNDACLSTAPVVSTQKTFSLVNQPSQCETLSVKYDLTRVSSAPSVRLFSPFGPAFLLNLTNNDPTRGIADYLINFFRGKEIVLLFDDGAGEQETSDLLTILGDSSSSGKCIFNELQNTVAPPPTMPSSTGLSKDIVIGLSVGGAVIIIISVAMFFYILRERRRRKIQITFDPAMLEKKPESFEYQPYQGTIPRPPQSIPSSIRESFVQDPPYTERQYLEANARRSSTSSWSPVLPRDHKTGAENKKQPTSYGSRLSLNSLDIEGMLNIAAVHSNRSSSQDPAPLGPVRQVSPTPPPQAILRPFPGRRRDRNPSDVPRGPTSMMSISSNPFSDENTIGPIEPRLPNNTPPIRPDRTGDPILSSPMGPRFVVEDRSSSNFGIAR